MGDIQDEWGEIRGNRKGGVRICLLDVDRVLQRVLHRWLKGGFGLVRRPKAETTLKASKHRSSVRGGSTFHAGFNVDAR